MKLDDLTTIDQLTNFLSGRHAVAFSVISDEKHLLTQGTLSAQAPYLVTTEFRGSSSLNFGI
ncbi:hypothetical protein MNBD_GAMMA18-1173 [hydrothermal vent metagenome]|uniref:Uncharacterized protein n=1 Tax=hydrothermal vent metagenome TaxID=652676 RepID=A0A3B0Z4R3_9ZZZZ